jgi:hypothetical protein
MVFAHHLELHHVPVLLCLFVAGCYIGWQTVGRLLPRRSPVNRDRPTD